MKTVLFACVHNAGRSQIAAAYFNQLADPSKARAISAGTMPGERVHPEVETVLRERGLELGATKPRLLTPELAAKAGLLITMGCEEQCPVVPRVERQDWPLTDPKGLPPPRVRAIADDIARRVAELIRERGWEKTQNQVKSKDRKSVV